MHQKNNKDLKLLIKSRVLFIERHSWGGADTRGPAAFQGHGMFVSRSGRQRALAHVPSRRQKSGDSYWLCPHVQLQPVPSGASKCSTKLNHIWNNLSTRPNAHRHKTLTLANAGQNDLDNKMTSPASRVWSRDIRKLSCERSWCHLQSTPNRWDGENGWLVLLNSYSTKLSRTFSSWLPLKKKLQIFSTFFKTNVYSFQQLFNNVWLPKKRKEKKNIFSCY